MVIPVFGVLPASGAAEDSPRAVDVSVEAGVYEQSHTWSANVHDFNNDGWDDILIVRHRFDSARLYRNDHGHFTEVSRGTFFSEEGSGFDRHDCAWGDANADGLSDVYCTLGGNHGTWVKQNELWLQQRDGSFVDRAAAFGVTDPYGRGRHATFIDVNKDGFQDLYVGNAFPRRDGQLSENRLYLNIEGTRFRSAPGYGLDREVGGRSVQAVDFDRDGWNDLLVCGQDRLHVFRNRRGESYRDVSGRTIGRRPCQAAYLTDVDGDGDDDLVNVAESRVTVHLRTGRDYRRVYGRPLGYGAALATGDVNGDSRPDLYVLQRGEEDRDRRDLLLVNEGSGRSFSRARMPQTTEGRGDAVASIDYDRNGLTDFVVLNGYGASKGPVRLIGFR